MLSAKELEFIKYWEENRNFEATFLRKLTAGLPFAILFLTPILFFVAAVYFFLPDWYAKISNTSQSTYVVVVIAVFIAVFFFAYFRMHFKWEMNEQLFLELKAKQKRENTKIA